MASVRLAVRIGLLAPAALLLTACEAPPIDIVIRNQASGRPIAAFSQSKGFPFSGRQTPCIRSAWLYRGTTATDPPVWHIRAIGEVQCLDLKMLVIGQVPRGFEQVVALPPKTSGPHVLTVLGIGFGKAALIL